MAFEKKVQFIVEIEMEASFVGMGMDLLKWQSDEFLKLGFEQTAFGGMTMVEKEEHLTFEKHDFDVGIFKLNDKFIGVVAEDICNSLLSQLLFEGIDPRFEDEAVEMVHDAKKVKK
jgi:hypothetical protein